MSTQQQPAANKRSDPQPGLLSGLGQNHARAFFFSAGKLSSHPLSSLLTALVIGITLALPAALHLLILNLDSLSFSWERTVQATLFLEDSLAEKSGRDLTQRLQARPEVLKAEYISREQALEEFRALSGFGQALDLLDENPLPAVIAVQPSKDASQAQIDALIKEMSNTKGVESARIDQSWLERLNAIITIVQHIVQALAVLLALAVVVTVGNTIRLDIQNRKAEIEVMKLLGATNAFVRRPFLYTGVWYGLCGGILAWLLLQCVLWVLANPISYLAGLYQSNFSLIGLNFEATMALFAGGIFLGWFGSWWTVSRHLSAIEPK